jgi:predicted amidohydrolase
LQDAVLLRKCRNLARDDPARALVLLWCHLRHQGSFERGFSRDLCLLDAKRAGNEFAGGNTAPNVHPVALLRAVDEHLALLDLGHEPFVRRIEVPVPPSAERCAFFVVPRPPRWGSRLALGQPGHLEFWMRRHQVVPTDFRGISIEIHRLSHDLLQKLAADRMAYVTGGFSDGILPEWSERSPFHCRQLKDSEARWRSVLKLLEDACGRGTALIVLPELTIDAQVRARMREWLRQQASGGRIGLVLAGSFHEGGTGGEAEEGSGHNVARLLDGYGDEVLQQKKLRPMRTTAGAASVDEDIEAGSHVGLLAAPFGLVGVAICLDFCEIGDAPVAELWQALGPALMLVPSMGGDTTNHAHRSKARPLALRHGTTTLVASQHPEKALACGLVCRRDAKARTGKPLLFGVLTWTGD